MDMETLKKLLSRASGIAVVAAVILSTGNAQAQYRTENFAVSDDVEVDVKTSGGSIEVYGDNRDEVVVEMYVTRRGRELDADDTDLDDWEIKIEKEGNKVYAYAKREGRSWGRDNFSVSFKVYTPVKATTELRTSGGSIELANLIGYQSAKTSGGSIRAEKIGGDVELRTSGGSITINDVEGAVDANTSGGRIKGEDITGGIIAKTSGGSIDLEGVSGNIEAKTSGGSIDVEALDPKDFIELRTSGGSISVTVPRDRGYDLNLDGNRVRADLENFKGEYERDEIEGTLNGGGTKLYARTSGGSVNLRYL